MTITATLGKSRRRPHAPALVLLAALGLPPASLQAQEPASAPASAASPAKRELVARVLKLHEPGFENMGRTFAEQSVQQLIVGVRAAIVRVPQDKREAVAREVEADMRRYLEDVVPLLRDRAVALAPATMGPLLEQRYSEDELRQLVTLLESPLVRKYQSASAEWQRALGSRLIAETKATVEPKLKALELAVTKRLRAALPAASTPGK